MSPGGASSRLISAAFGGRLHLGTLADGKPDKRSDVYASHLPSLLSKLKRRRELAAIPELERFVGKLSARGQRVKKKRSKA